MLSKAGKPKKLALYKERRFGLLGYSAAALLHHIDDLKNTLSDTGSNNQLVQACELYLDIEYIEVALRCVAWFNYKVTLPFLNMCELETPETLLSILSALYHDFNNSSMDTLQKYTVEYSFEVKQPVSKLENYILERFCKQGAIDLQRQRGREFGFSNESEKPRCSDLTKVDPEVLSKLSVHNLLCETDLSHMDKIANRAASCSNRNFTAKSMRDDMTLYQAKVVSIDKETKAIAKLLDEDERKWFNGQEDITKNKLAEKRAKAIRKDERLNIILRICKDHGGPFTSVKEIDVGMKTVKDEQERKKMLRNEILLRKSMCKKDCREHPDLYKVNSMTVAQLKVNLGILLSGNHEEECDANVTIPDVDSMFSVLDNSLQEPAPPVETDVEDEIMLNEPCAAIWDNANGREWCVGMTRERIGKDEYLIDYLECKPNDRVKKMWRYPSKVDEQKTQRIQILPCNVIGSWDLTKRKPVFVLHNNDVIDELFKSLYCAQC